MYVVWKRLKNFTMLAPAAWFNEEADAQDYVAYLATVNEEGVVVYDEGFSIAGTETVVPSLGSEEDAEIKL